MMSNQAKEKIMNFTARLWKTSSLGFTLIEMVLVVAILAVFAMVAMPSLSVISQSVAKENSMVATLVAVRAGLSLYGSNELAQGNALSFPLLLETTDLPNGTKASIAAPLFNNVLRSGITSKWIKLDDDCYAYDANNNGKVDDRDTKFHYLFSYGTFLKSDDCGM